MSGLSSDPPEQEPDVWHRKDDGWRRFRGWAEATSHSSHFLCCWTPWVPALRACGMWFPADGVHIMHPFHCDLLAPCPAVGRGHSSMKVGHKNKQAQVPDPVTPIPVRWPVGVHCWKIQGRWQLVFVVIKSLSHVWLWPHGLQHTRLPCLSLSPGVCSNSCPLSWWCYLTVSSSVVPFSSLQSFPASGSFPVSQLFTSSGQSIGVSVSASVLPMNIQSWFPLQLTGLISLLSKGLSGVFSSTTIWKHQFFNAQPSLWSNSHVYTWPLETP